MMLSDVSIKRPVFATMLNMVLIVFGLFGYSKLGIDQYPNVDFPFVTVQVVYPGADPKSVEQRILEPLEKGLNGLEGLDKLITQAYPNLAQVVLQFKLERNGDKAAQDVRDKMSALVAQLPEDIKQPVIGKFDVGAQPILILGLSSDKSVSFGELSRLGNDVVKPLIEQSTGVGRVDIVGYRPAEVHVRARRADMQGFGLSPAQVMQSIQAQNLDIPSGKVQSASELLRIRTEGTLRDVDEIRKLPITLRTGQKIAVETVADVEETIALEDTYANVNGQDALSMTVYKQSGGNTVSLAEATRATVQSVAKNLPKGVTLQIIQDNSIYIKGSIDSVKFDLVLGALLAVIIVLLFLHDWRATMISAVAIPTSVIGTFAFVQYMGFTLNMMTTLAVTLSIGILVDDAIVVIENIYRRIELGETPLEAAQRGTSEIGLAALAITLSIVAVFVPVAFMEGIIGRFFYQFGMTVACSVMISLFVAFTLTPMMSSRYLKQHAHGPEGKAAFFRPIERALQRLEARYKGFLDLCLGHCWKTVGVGFGVLVLSVFLLGFVPKTFFGNEDRSMLSVQYELREGTPLPVTKAEGLALQKRLRAYPGVKDVVMSIGANAEKKPNLARFDINLVDKHARSFSQDQFINRLREDLKPMNAGGARVEVNSQQGGGGGKAQPIQVVLSGNDYAELSKYARELKDWVGKNVPGAVDVSTTEPPDSVELRVLTNPALAADLNLSSAQVGQTLRPLFEGQKIGEIDKGEQRIDVRFLMRDDNTRDVSDLRSMAIVNPQGQQISLPSIARIETGSAPAKIERLGGRKQITVLANFTGKALNEAMNTIRAHAEKSKPAGVSADFDGQGKMFADAAKSVGTSMLLAILLVYMVLCAQFESYVVPFVIMMSVPLAFSGAFAGLLVTGMVMGIFSMIGLIMLVGLVTKNAILLIDFSLHKMTVEGLPVRQALVEAGAVRLRPILMTTLAMIFGMLPIAMGHGVGGEARAPMAVCVIGGLISSTVLTLVVVPCIFSLIQGVRGRKNAKGGNGGTSGSKGERHLVHEAS